MVEVGGRAGENSGTFGRWIRCEVSCWSGRKDEGKEMIWRRGGRISGERSLVRL